MLKSIIRSLIREPEHASMSFIRTSAASLVRRNNSKSEEEFTGEDADKSEANTDNNMRLGHDDDHENVMKVVQRFGKDPREWPAEDQPFAMIDKNFLGKVMHTVELRPERGFANFVPIGTMLIRHFFRKVQAQTNFKMFQHTGIFEEEDLRAGTKTAFELISQNAYKNTMADLVDRDVCAQATVDRFEGASKHMSERQRELLNLTEDDIFAIAPGVLGPYQFIRPVLYNKEPHLSRGLLCCAFYKKTFLFDQVKSLPLLENPSDSDKMTLPSEYGYAAPRLIFGYLTFGNKAMSGRELDSEVKLLDFQYLVM